MCAKWILFWLVVLLNMKKTVKLHKPGPLLQTVGHPFPLLLGQLSSALLSTAQAGGPPSVENRLGHQNYYF